MTHELLTWLAHATVATTVAVVCVLVFRRWLRMAFGGAHAYAIWLLVPTAATASLLQTDTLHIAQTHAGVSTLVHLGQLASTWAAPTSAPISGWIVAAWIAGAAFTMVILSAQQWRFVRSLGSLSDRNGIYYSEHKRVSTSVVGLIRPRIVVPADFDSRYTAEERAVILAHERRHVRRGDLLSNTVDAVLRCVFWFNPLMHWATSRFRFDQELACDAQVLAAAPHARAIYARAMLKAQWLDVGSPSGCNWNASHPLVERIGLLRYSGPCQLARAGCHVLVFTLLCTFTYGTFALRAGGMRILATPSHTASTAPVPVSLQDCKKPS